MRTTLETLINDFFTENQKTKNYRTYQENSVIYLEIPVIGIEKDQISVTSIGDKIEIEYGIADHYWTPKNKNSFLLPNKISKIDANVENGLLTISINLDETKKLVKIL